MTKRIILIVLVLILSNVFSLAAFAAVVPPDVAGTDFVKAVSKLQGFGIMQGDTSGLFRPGDSIKRSEFAKIAVIAMGLNDAASVSKGSTKFSDVAADHWASGFINVAVGANIINGYPDGNFHPDNTITYSEAITILVKMLGYGPVLQGEPWPGAYVAKANDVRITSGVVLAPTTGVSRGNVAKLLSNTLDCKVVSIGEYADTQRPIYTTNTIGSSLLASKLKVTQIGSEPLTVVKTPALLEDLKPNSVLFSDGSQYEMTGSLSADDYLGLDIKVWKNDDNKIVVAEIQTQTGNFYDGDIDVKDSKIRLVSRNMSFDLASTGFTGYINKINYSNEFLKTIVSGTANGRVVLTPDGSKISRAYVTMTLPKPSPTPVPTPAPDSGTNPGPALKSGNSIISFSFAGLDYQNTIISTTEHSLEVTIPIGTDRTNLKAEFQLSSGATAKIGDALQTSGATPNDFSQASKIYAVTAENGSSVNWTVSIIEAIGFVTGPTDDDGDRIWRLTFVSNAPSAGIVEVKVNNDKTYAQTVHQGDDKAMIVSDIFVYTLHNLPVGVVSTSVDYTSNAILFRQNGNIPDDLKITVTFTPAT